LKRYKLPGTTQTSAELIQAEGKILHSHFHKLIHSILNTEEMPQQWKEYIILPVYKKYNKTEIALYHISYNILFNILQKLNPYGDKIIEDHQCGFHHNRSTTDQILSYNILTEFGIPIKLVWLNKTFLNETYSNIHRHNLLMHFLFRIQKDQEYCERLVLNGTHEVLPYSDVKLLGKNRYT
jgi:hypothetical protein